MENEEGVREKVARDGDENVEVDMRSYEVG